MSLSRNTAEIYRLIMSLFLQRSRSALFHVPSADGGRSQLSSHFHHEQRYLQILSRRRQTWSNINSRSSRLYKYIQDQRRPILSHPWYAFCAHIPEVNSNITASLDPRPTQDALGLAHRLDTQSIHQACNIFEAKISTYDSVLLDSLINDEYRQAGTVCHSTEEYLATPHGQANAHVGLYSVNYIHNPAQIPTWWTSVEGHTNVSRPLFGLKIIDLTRIIAAPTIGRELAELGASVLRITSPNVPDVSLFNIDVGWGKWNSSLDLTQKRDRATLKALILESDVVIDGYRPGVMDKWGFGKDEILEMFQGREKGVILARENCFVSVSELFSILSHSQARIIVLHRAGMVLGRRARDGNRSVMR